MKALLFAVLFASAVDFEVAPVIPDAQPATYDSPSVAEVCGAFAVFSAARHDGFGEQAMIVYALRNSPDGLCESVLALPEMLAWAPPREPWREGPAWANAIAVSSAVLTGDFYIPPPCRGAQTFHSRDSPAAPGTVDICESGRFAFGRIVPADVSP